MRMKKNKYIEIDVIGLSDLKVNSCKEFSYGEGDWPLRGFVAHYNQDIFAYHNRCPHAGHQLNWQANDFLTSEKNNIVCSSHGAIFDILTGKCIAGPCLGDKLKKFRCFLRDQRVIVTIPSHYL